LHEGFFFIITQDHSILNYESDFENLKVLDTPLMPINDEYEMYTSRSLALEFLWALFTHFKSILHKNAFTFHVYSILVDESTNQTVEQHLIICCYYLGFQGKDYQMTSFLELLVIKGAIRENMLISLCFY